MLQWNLLMVKKAGTNVIFNVRTSLAARHNHIISGSVLADKVCNIYDLEGCRREWTTEKSDARTVGGYGPFVYRGGAVTSDYGDGGKSASHRSFRSESNTAACRLVLYVM